MKMLSLCSRQLPEYIYIGGFSGDHKIGEVTKMSFEGCIDGFQINSEAVDINKNLNAHGVIPGCPERVRKNTLLANRLTRSITI